MDLGLVLGENASDCGGNNHLVFCFFLEAEATPPLEEENLTGLEIRVTD